MTDLTQIVSLKEDTKNNEGLQFGKINIDPDYRKKWNIREEDFVCLTKNGELLRPTLYRIGGLGTPKLNVDRYFMILKHVEAYYSDEIMEMSKKHSKNANPRHLEGRWCILDKEGNEKVEFKAFSRVYLVADSCLYTLDNDYYNIETGEHYGSGYTSIKSKDFVFIDNTYDKDESKRGVMKINKNDGSWELFK